MQAARRLYLYVMSGIALAVATIGLVVLIEVAIDEIGILRRPAEYGMFQNLDPRQQLSQAVAMLGVGVPVWAIHWWLVRRGLAPGKRDREAEHGSAIRAGYLTLVLAVSLLIWVSSASSVLASQLWSAAGGGSSFLYTDDVNAASTSAVAFGVWLYHGIVRRGDLATPVRAAAAWLPRLYLYGVALGALVVAVTGFQGLMHNLLAIPEYDEGYARLAAVQGGVTFGAWGVVWATHWWYASRLTAADGWRGLDEQVSKTRLGAFIATIVVAVGFSVSSIADVFQGVVAPLIGKVPYQGDLIDRAVLPLAVAIPWLLAWWAHVRWLRREPAAADPLRAIHQVRLATHAPAAMALALGGTGLGWLLGLGIDIAFGGNRRSDPSGVPWTFELARWLPMAIAGLSIWAWHWSGVLGRQRVDPDGEANSAIRRAFLYLTLGVGVVVALASATLILYRLVGSILGAALNGNTVSELSTPIGALVVACLVLAYHANLLRADQRRRPVVVADVPPIAMDDGPGLVVAEAPPSTTRRSLELVGPEGGDIDAALASARAALPEDFELVAREP